LISSFLFIGGKIFLFIFMPSKLKSPMTIRRFTFLAAIFLLARMAVSQEIKVKLWEGDPPGSKKTQVNGGERISKVTDPELTVFLPEKSRATGTAVVICPGGGYGRLAIDHEGYDVAKWFQSMGAAGMVLKYRLPSDLIMEKKEHGPLQDAQEAIRLVRSKAAEWNIDPGKVGVIGFSAGGHLASTLSTHYGEPVYQSKYNESARPDFSILIYPVVSMKEGITHNGSRRNLLGERPDETLVNRFSNETRVDDQTPPAFIVHSTDDKTVPVLNSILYYQELAKRHIPAELHIYQRGGHGYGLAERLGPPPHWPDACKKWMIERGYLNKDL